MRNEISITPTDLHNARMEQSRRVPEETREVDTTIQLIEAAKNAGISGSPDSDGSPEYKLADLLTARLFAQYFDARTGAVQFRQVWEDHDGVGAGDYVPQREQYAVAGLQEVLSDEAIRKGAVPRHVCIPAPLLMPEIADAWKSNSTFIEVDHQRDLDKGSEQEALSAFSEAYSRVSDAEKRDLVRGSGRFLSLSEASYTKQLEALSINIRHYAEIKQ